MKDRIAQNKLNEYYLTILSNNIWWNKNLYYLCPNKIVKQLCQQGIQKLKII